MRSFGKWATPAERPGASKLGAPLAPGACAAQSWVDGKSTSLRDRRLADRLFGRLPPGQHPVGAQEMAGVAVGVALQVILVLWLRLPEVPHRLDLGHGLARPNARSVDVGDGVLGDPLLLIVDVVDRRPVGDADVVALPVSRGGIVDLEEDTPGSACS